MTTVMQNLQSLQETYSAAWAAHDPEGIADLHTEDTRFEMHIGTPPIVGRAALRKACEEIFQLYGNFRSELHRVLYGDAHWVLEWRLHATLDGKDLSIDCVDVVVVSEEGLVARKDSYMDAGQLQSALS
jgi:uncharacterized protein (TIGR02246 family)